MLVCVGACQCSKSVGFHGVGIAEQKWGLSLSGEGREIERAQEGARPPPASGARARGEMDAGGLACAAIGTCLRTFFLKRMKKPQYTEPTIAWNDDVEKTGVTSYAIGSPATACALLK